MRWPLWLWSARAQDNDVARRDIEHRLDTGRWSPGSPPHHDTYLSSGCWLCPAPNTADVNSAYLCAHHTDQLR